MKTDIKCRIIFIFLVMLCLPVFAMANEQLIFPEYTEEYKKWMELPEEEKVNYIQPQMYEKIGETDDVQQFSDGVDNSQLTATKLPTKFSRTDYGKVKDQGNTNACWAYSAATVFETNYYITNGTKKEFSNLHMDYATSQKYNEKGFNRTTDTGGNIHIAVAYATNGVGIALESDMPVEGNRTQDTIAAVPADSKVSDYINLYDIADVKNYLYKYGVVSASTYMGDSQYFSSTNYYNNDDLAYYCADEDLVANHAITIIGWDDNYTNSSFPDQTGAYIVLNSYGQEFGDNGIYYIFYDDIFMQSSFLGVTAIDEIDYDNLYQYDEYGCIAEIGFETTYAANVFTRENTKNREHLNEVSAYFPEAGQAKIYINANNEDVATKSATYTQTAYIEEPGYHTIKLSREVTLANDQFVVGIKYPGIMGIEMNAGFASDWCYTVTSNYGESYISSDGENYADLQALISSQIGYEYSNACIKAFTQNVEEAEEVKPTPEPEYTADLADYVFDYKYYADHNLDLYNIYGYNETALRKHWKLYGKAEGRKASPILDLTYYVSNNADIKAAFGNNYVAAYNHFISGGYAEFRASSAEYSGAYYKKYNADLKDFTSMQLIRHYSLHGKSELRAANQTYDIVDYLFDAAVYAELNPDVVSVLGNSSTKLKDHWYRHGIAEGRIASLVFDAKSYLKLNKDVAAVFGAQNYKSAYEHFINCGFSEGRQGSIIFNAKYYLSQNSDLKKIYGSNQLKAINHFVNYGKNEARLTSAYFKVAVYRNKNADLKNAYKENYAKYFIHYLSYGQYENRVCK